MPGILLMAAESGAEEVIPHGLPTSDWIRAGVILVGTIVAARVVQAIIERTATRADVEGPLIPLLARVVRNIAILGGFLAALGSLSVQLGPLLGALGIGGLAVAFAGQTILENFFSSILLRTRRPMRRGDQVTAAGHDGSVEDINLRVVVLRSYDGERIYLPCSQVLRNPIVNHTVNGARRTTLRVSVAYDTDLEEAGGILLAAAQGAGGVRPVPPPEAWVERFGDSSIDFALRFWHEPEQASMWRTRDAVARAVKRSLDEAGIEIPFPHRTIGFAPPVTGAEERFRLR
jgi:small-conductance mechanosensitive channel